MSKVKTKKIKLQVGLKDEGLAEVFNSMLGAGSVNMTIAYPRYVRMKSLCEQLVKLFKILAASPFMRAHSEFAVQKQQIEDFCRNAETQIAESFKMDLSDYEWNLTTVEDELKKKFAEVYEAMKQSNLVNTFIIMCDRLVKHKKNFTDMEKLNHKFINSMPGAEWCPFPFTSLNLKYVFSLGDVRENTITFFMTVLAKAYELSRNLYDETQTPDIDVDQFVEIIANNIDEIQKRPELSRCQKAFKKIKESVVLLKNRFNGYYRDFIATKDSTIIMQHFVLDVSKETSADPEVTRQFKTIIGYYRKIAQSQITNPKVKVLFDKVNQTFEQLERGTENLVNIRDDKDDGGDGGDDEPEIPKVAPVAKSAEDLVKK